MFQSIKRSDGFVDEGDFTFVKEAVSNNRIAELVNDLIAREPEIAFGVSALFDRTLRLLKVLEMTPAQRMAVESTLAVLAWSPLIATTRAYRRAWEDLLPSDNSHHTEGGGQ